LPENGYPALPPLYQETFHGTARLNICINRGQSLFETPYRKNCIVLRFSLSAVAAVSLAILLGTAGRAQSIASPHLVQTSLYRTEGLADLPDAPTPQGELATGFSSSFGEAESAGAPARTPRFAPKPLAPIYNKYIEPSQRAQPLTGVGRKFLFGADQIVSPYFFVAVVGSATYEQATNGSPNYGTNGGAYGQRLGAAAIRDASQSIFTDGLMPAVFHQDPRYYVRGKSHNAFARGTYAVSRVFITKTDDGANAPNYSLFAGHAATSILQNAYYPDVNHGVEETAKGFASSFAGAALSNTVREFFPDLLHLVHLE